MSFPTPQVIAALNHVRQFLPDVTQVFYGCDQRWHYMDDDGESACFKGTDIDVSVLEDAADSLSFFPAAFHFTTPVREPSPGMVTVTIKGGMVQELRSNWPGLGVHVCDLDTIDSSDGAQRLAQCKAMAPFEVEEITLPLEPQSPAAPYTGKLLEVLQGAESFIAGFEGDELQEGVEGVLSGLRAAIADIQIDCGQAPSAENLLARVSRDMQQLRELIEEPQVLNYSEKVYLEVAPAAHDQRVNVCHREMGWTTVNYTAEGLIVDVFNAGNDPEPISELGFHYDDLATREGA